LADKTGIHFTPHQQAAIDCDAPHILVSAAAGSGKTAVLTARVMRHLREGRKLDSLLIVTFTEAAAAGMKDKITAQGVQVLPGADISTIHAFCMKIVKTYFQEVGLDPAFRVGDDAELGLIRAQVMEALFEAEYQAAGEDDLNGFIDLVDVFGGKSGDIQLDALVRKLHDFLESDPFPEAAAARYTQQYTDFNGIDGSPYAAIAREELERGLRGALRAIDRALELCHQPDGPEKYIDRLEADAQMLEHLMDEINAPFAHLYQATGAIDWGKLARITAKDNVDETLKTRVQTIRNKYVKDAIKALTKGIFFAPPDKMCGDIRALAPRISALMGLAIRYAAAYAEEKRARNLLDFSDLEHFAIRILYPGGPGTPPSSIATTLARQYHEVLIDEYQDANELQERILSAVCARRFMVGDVKQSIYRFRRANPALFRAKYETYTKFTDSAPPVAGSAIRIDLSQNFRSRAEVVDGINFFFRQIMSKSVGEIEYDDAAELKPGASYPPMSDGMAADLSVEVHIVNEHKPTLSSGVEGNCVPLAASGAAPQALDLAFDLSRDFNPAPTPIQAEALLIARLIHQLLATRHPVWDNSLKTYRPCRLSDMVILTRSISSTAAEIIETLKNNGIAALAEANAGFYDQQEIKTALALLRVVDNPRQDIELITVLFSPVYGLDADDLLAIRRTREDGDFYDCVQASNHPKLDKFKHDLAIFRSAATILPISRLLGLVYDTTRYPAHVAAMPAGDARLANLRLLMEHAIRFEDTRLTGLFHFTRYIARLHETRATENFGVAATDATDSDTPVQLMTIHKSKGLEFPIVFVSFMGRKFNPMDERAPIILHGEYGAGPFYTDTSARTRANTLPRATLARKTHHENLSEELRCLYVALTRAQEKLILTARTPDYAQSCEKWEDAPDPAGATNYLDWIMPILLQNAKHPGITLHIHPPQALPAIASNAQQSAQLPSHPLPTAAPPAHIIATPSETPASPSTDNPITPQPAQQIPSKLSISELKRLYASDLTPDSTPHDLHATELPPLFEPPRFIQAEAGLTAMRMGSVLHTLTEHMDYQAHTTPESIESLIADLTQKNLLTSEEAKAINRTLLLTLAQSPLGNRIRAAAAQGHPLQREVPFVLQLETGTLVHGIIDAFFEEDDQIVLIDFKSDHAHTTTEAELVARHATQLDIYKKAVAQATAKAVKEVLLYSFSLGKAITI